MGLLSLIFAAVALAAPLNDAEVRARAAVQLARADLNSQHWVSLESSLRDLGLHAEPLVMEELLEMLELLPLSHRPVARRRLGAPANDDEWELLLGRPGLRHRSATVRSQVLRALGEHLPTGADWGAAAEAALEDREDIVRAEAVWALGRVRREASMPSLLAAASDEAAIVRAFVPDALTRLAGSRSTPTLGILLRDPSERVRAASARALGDLRTDRAARLLLDQLGTEDGRVREDLAESLGRLTGRGFGLSIDAWARWDELNGSKPLVPGVLPSVVSEESDRPAPTQVAFYGVPSLSSRFVTVSDLSGSMAAVDRGNYGDRDGSEHTRLEVTQDELRKLVRSLEPPVMFGLITFADGVRVWRPRLSLASERDRAAALREIESYRAEGGTNMFAALEKALDLAENIKGKAPGPDTVYLLSDGAPRNGKIQDFDLLLNYVLERNRYLGVRFHCVSLTTDRFSLSFLDELAEATGGVSVHPIR